MPALSILCCIFERNELAWFAVRHCLTATKDCDVIISFEGDQTATYWFMQISALESSFLDFKFNGSTTHIYE